MSDSQKTQTKKVTKPKTVTPKPTSEPQVQSDAEKPKVRINDVLGNFISSARVRRDIDDRTLNKVNDDKMTELKAQIAEYLAREKAQSDPATSQVDKDANTKYLEENKSLYNLVDSQIKSLSKDRIRFSNTAAPLLAMICDEFVKEIAHFSLAKTLESGKKNVHPEHIHQSGVESLSLYALFKDLPSFLAMSAKLNSERSDVASQLALKNKLQQAEKDFKKKYNVHITKEQREKEKASSLEKVAEKASEPETKSDEVKEGSETKEVGEEDVYSYKYYIDKLFKSCKPEGVSLRVTTETKVYVSNLVEEFLDRFANQVRLTIISMGNKTVNDKAIFYTLKYMLIMGHTPVETLEFVTVDDKLTTVHKRKYPTTPYSSIKKTLSEKTQKYEEMHEKASADNKAASDSKVASDSKSSTA